MIFNFMLSEVPRTFDIHDLSDFPVVRFDSGQVAPGYAKEWVREMELLLDLNEPFVLVASGAPEETQEDRKTRALFLKSHRRQLSRLCRAVIGIEPSSITRAVRNAQAAVMGRAFGIDMLFVGDESEATSAARARLRGGAR